MTQISLPFRVDRLGRIATESRRAYELADNLGALIATHHRERVMRPNYGSRAWDTVFDANDPAVAQVLMTDIERAIKAWEPGVKVTSIRPFEMSPRFQEVESTMSIQVNFRVVDEEEIITYSAIISLAGEVTEVTTHA